MEKYLYIFTILAILVSFLANKKKTFKALKIAFKRLYKITPAFLSMLILISIVLFFLPDHAIAKYLGNSHNFLDVLLGTILGSLTLMPGFITFPLAAILLQKGVSYMTLAAFTTSLMMVGILTFPIEKKYFGTKVTIIRNVLSLIISLCITIVIGFAFGEIL